MSRILTFVIILSIYTINSYGSEIDPRFRKIWEATKVYNPALKAVDFNSEAERVRASKASMHWVPRIYLAGQVYRTDDAPQSFFSVLSQRAVTSSDFVPDSLNNPQSRNYFKSSIGANLPLYEGGVNHTNYEIQKISAQQSHLRFEDAKIKTYKFLGESYVGIHRYLLKITELEKLKNNLEHTISRYQVGRRSSPVGYSGLLGMKSVLSRIQASLIESKSEVERLTNQIISLSGERFDSNNLNSSILDLENIFPNSGKNEIAKNAEVRIAELDVEKSDKAISLEYSKYLPRLGVFAERNFYDGNRSSAGSYVVGGYLQLNIFGPEHLSAAKEGIEKMKAAEMQLRATSSERDSRTKSLRSTQIAIQGIINELKVSEELLAEQLKTSRELFESGSINSLQYVEVLSRKVDLLDQVLKTNLQMTQVRAELWGESVDGKVLL